MTPQFKKGDSVRYKPIGGSDSSSTSDSVHTGVIRSVFSAPGRQAKRNVQAIDEGPRYEIEDSITGKFTTIYESNILGLVD
ncbi:hypothetical protein MD484_g7528, partial [Candolleomyces efflorescens]